MEPQLPYSDTFKDFVADRMFSPAVNTERARAAERYNRQMRAGKAMVEIIESLGEDERVKTSVLFEAVQQQAGTTVEESQRAFFHLNDIGYVDLNLMTGVGRKPNVGEVLPEEWVDD